MPKTTTGIPVIIEYSYQNFEIYMALHAIGMDELNLTPKDDPDCPRLVEALEIAVQTIDSLGEEENEDLAEAERQVKEDFKDAMANLGSEE